MSRVNAKFFYLLAPCLLFVQVVQSQHDMRSDADGTLQPLTPNRANEYIEHNRAPVGIQQKSVGNTVSFWADVEPDEYQKNFNVVRGTQQISTSQLNELIRPDGGYVLRIRSIHAHLIPGIPLDGDYAAVFLAACSPENSVYGFGAGTLAVGGTANEQVLFSPGVVAWLATSHSLCLRSLIQSNYNVRVLVHGTLVPAD